MRLRNAGRAVVVSTAAVVAAALMGGAFAASIDQKFNYCMENQSDTDSVATRMACCDEAGGAWVEIYDSQGRVIDAFCDGAEEVYEPEGESIVGGTINPAALDNVVSAEAAVVGSDPTPAPAEVVAASASDPSIESASSEPGPAPEAQPAPEKKKRKHRHHRRHR